MSDNQELKTIIKNKEVPDLSQWSPEKINALLSIAASQHKAQFIYELVRNNNRFISIELLEKVIYQAISLSNSTIITKLMNAALPENKMHLVKKTLEHMLALDLADMLYKSIKSFPYMWGKSSESCVHYVPQILGTFFFKKHIDGLRFILKKNISDKDINFYCRRAAKDNEPDMVEIFISSYAEKLEPMTKGVVLMNLTRFGQAAMLLLFFNKIKFTDHDYLERALVKAVREGHVPSVEHILSQPIEWTEALTERAIDKALTYKQDNCLLKIIPHKIKLFSAESLQNLVLDACTNGCMKSVDLLLDKYPNKIWSKTKGELLLILTKNDNKEYVQKLIPSKQTKIKSPYKQRAYLLALKENNSLRSFFESTYHGIENAVTEKELTEGSKLNEEVNQALTFQFSRLRVSKKELVEECNQTKKPTKSSVLH